MKKHRQFRQIEQKEEKSRTGLYLTIFLVVVMIGGVAGIFLSNPDSSVSYTYGKFGFKNANNKWTTKINKQDVSFYFLPDQLQKIAIPGQAIDALKNGQLIVIAFNPNENSTQRLQAIDLFRFDMVTAMSATDKTKQMAFAVTQKSPSYTFPVVTCSNASFTTPIITIDYTNETSVHMTQNSCIVVEAVNDYDLLQLLDAFKYRLYGVING